MPQFSIRLLLVLVAYIAVCSFVYVTPNLWIGWLVFFATSLVIAAATISSFKNRDRFKLGFAVTSSVALVTFLGFAIETSGISSSKTGNEFRGNVNQWLQLDRSQAERKPIEKRDPKKERVLHHLYYSIGLSSKRSPDWINLSRLLVCLSSLTIGLIGGLLCHSLKIPRNIEYGG